MSSITKNLISMSQCVHHNNAIFVFPSNECLVKSQATDDVILQELVGPYGFYVFPRISTNTTNYTRSSINSVSINNILFGNAYFLQMLLFTLLIHLHRFSHVEFNFTSESIQPLSSTTTSLIILFHCIENI